MSKYTVQKGDSFWKIANKHNISMLELLKANSMKSTDVIRTGQQLVIPNKSNSGTSVTLVKRPEKPERSTTNYSQQGTYVSKNDPYNLQRRDIKYFTDAPKTSPKTYTIKKHDTLSKIAKDNGLSLEQLLKLNNLKKGSIIYEGDTLVVDNNYYRTETQYPARPSTTNTNTKPKKGGFGGGERKTGGAGTTVRYGAPNPYGETPEYEDGLVLMSFDDAFAAARKRGDKTFEWNGKLYGTQLSSDISREQVQRALNAYGVVPKDEWVGIKVTRQ